MGQVWVWGKGRKDKRGRGLDAGRWTWKGLPWKDCTLLGKVEQTRSESQTPGGGEDTAARPEPGLPVERVSAREWGPSLGLVAHHWRPWTGGSMFATVGRASWVKGRPCALGNTGNELGRHFSLVRSVVQNSDCVLRRGGVSTSIQGRVPRKKKRKQFWSGGDPDLDQH